MWIAACGLLFLAPFGVTNMLTGRFVLGLGATAVVGVLLILSWLAYRGRSTVLSLCLVPPVVTFLVLSIHEQGVIGVMWAYPGVVCFYFVLREKLAWIANLVTLATVVPVSVAILDLTVALRAMVTLSVVSVFSIMAVRVIEAQQQRLEEMAITDSLTGLLNRSLFIPTLEQAISRHRRDDVPATLLTLDIDHFKGVNDSHGHSRGDEILTEIARLLVDRLRPTDVVFRTGGEEFAIVLPDTDGEPGHHVGQMLRTAIAGEPLLPGEAVTVSIGAARLHKDDSARSWAARSDQFLYEAKRQGRNRVVADGAIPPTTPAIP